MSPLNRLPTGLAQRVTIVNDCFGRWHDLYWNKFRP